MHVGAIHMAELFGRGYFTTVCVLALGLAIAAASFLVMQGISFLAQHIVIVS